MFEDSSLFSILLKGGWMLLFIFISSVVAIAIILERYISYTKIKKNTKDFAVIIENSLEKNDLSSIKSEASARKTYLSKMILTAFIKIKFGRKQAEESVEKEGKREIFELEKGLSTLATISGVAPLLGFLGTVTGMIQAFMQVDNLEGFVNPSDLAGGIWEALITTAFGLGVGIIALTAYNYFVSQVKKMVLEMEIVAGNILDKLQENNEI